MMSRKNTYQDSDGVDLNEIFGRQQIGTTQKRMGFRKKDNMGRETNKQIFSPHKPFLNRLPDPISQPFLIVMFWLGCRVESSEACSDG